MRAKREKTCSCGSLLEVEAVLSKLFTLQLLINSRFRSARTAVELTVHGPGTLHCPPLIKIVRWRRSDARYPGGAKSTWNENDIYQTAKYRCNWRAAFSSFPGTLGMREKLFYLITIFWNYSQNTIKRCWEGREKKLHKLIPAKNIPGLTDNASSPHPSFLPGLYGTSITWRWCPRVRRILDGKLLFGNGVRRASSAGKKIVFLCPGKLKEQIWIFQVELSPR